VKSCEVAGRVVAALWQREFWRKTEEGYRSPFEPAVDAGLGVP
jgi:hypothetical protein